MKSETKSKAFLLLSLCVAVGPMLVALVAGRPPQVLSDDPRDRQIAALSTALNEERVTSDALKKAIVERNAQLQQQQQQLAPACIATIEKANAGKKVDPSTFVITDKPALPVEKPGDPKKGGG